MPLRFICNRQDGIGGRLIPLINCARLAKKLNCKFLFYWTNLPHIKNDDEIFLRSSVFRFEQITFSNNYNPSASANLNSFSTHSDQKNISRINTDKLLKYNADIEITSPFNIYLLDEEDEKLAIAEFRDVFISLFHRSVFSKSISFLCDHECFTGIHLRLGDVAKSEITRIHFFLEKYIPEEIVFQYCAEFSSRRFLLATNSCGLRIESLPNVTRIPTFHPESEILQALNEIFILSKSTNIIAPDSSAFSYLARILGSPQNDTSHMFYCVGISFLLKTIRKDCMEIAYKNTYFIDGNFIRAAMTKNNIVNFKFFNRVFHSIFSNFPRTLRFNALKEWASFIRNNNADHSILFKAVLDILNRGYTFHKNCAEYLITQINK